MTPKQILENMMKSDGMQTFVSTYNVATTAFLAICTLATIIMVIFNIVKLAKSADNPQERKTAISGLIVCLVSFSMLTCVDVVYGIAVSMILGLL